MRIEVYFSPHCTACSKALQTLRTDVRFSQVEWRDILAHLNDAVAYGILTPPGLVVDGKLLAQGPGVPSRVQELINTAAGMSA